MDSEATNPQNSSNEVPKWAWKPFKWFYRSESWKHVQHIDFGTKKNSRHQATKSADSLDVSPHLTGVKAFKDYQRAKDLQVSL